MRFNLVNSLRIDVVSSVGSALMALWCAALGITSMLTTEFFVKSEATMIYIEGGTFSMGDVLGDGAAEALPVHRVTLDSFYISAVETTVEAYELFVTDTDYLTTAEQISDRAEQEQRLATLRTRIEEGGPPDDEIMSLMMQIVADGGCSTWDSERGAWDYSLDCNWRNPLFAQTPKNPVVCMSWNDAASYCNWLSLKEGLPPAYDIATGELLDAAGKPTADIRQAKGYRLPTEAEWEYAARERGRECRFGNGHDTARISEINFDAGRGSYDYAQAGETSTGTVPAGSLAPNSLGLYEMSGNAWEWCSDYYGDYGAVEQVNPFLASGTERVIRGGRWGGEAREALVFKRARYRPSDRCNNAGFRIARSE